MAEIIIDVTEQIIEVVANNGAYPITGYVPYIGATSDLNIGNNNIYTNNLFEKFVSLTASGTQLVLTVSSGPSIVVTGSGGQTIKLPDATTLPNGATYYFNNNQSSGVINVNNNSNTLVKSAQSGSYLIITLLDNSIAAGSWDAHFEAPSNVSWSTNTFDYVGSITGATWNGVAVAINRGGTGATTSAAALTNLGGIGGSGTTNILSKFSGSTAIGNSNITDSGTLISLGSDTTISSGALGIGTSTLTGYSLNIAKNITGATSAYGVRSQGIIQSDVTTLAASYASLLNTVAATFTLTDYVHYRSMQGTIGTNSIITNQYGFYVDSSLTGATNNYAIYSNIASGSNRWNIYMNGTAANYLAGVLNIGSTTLSGFKLDVTGTSRFIGTTASDTAPLGSELANVLGTGTNWTLAGTDLSVGGYTHTTGSVVALTTSLAAVSGTYYQIAYTITGRTTGTITIAYGGNSITVSATGATGPLASSTAVLTITPTTDFDGTVVLSIKTIGTSVASSTFSTSGGTVNLEVRTTTASNSTFIGLQTGRRNTTGISNTFYGVIAGRDNTTGSENTFIGSGSGQVNTIATSNTFLGSNTGANNNVGSNNTFIGGNSGLLNTSGNTNTFLGRGAGQNNTSGFGNVMIGNDSGRFITGGSTANATSNQSIFIGQSTKAAADNQTNQIVIGFQTTGLGSNTTIIGNSSTTITGLYGNIRLTSGMGTAPASATATGTTGDIVVTASAIYVCSATNTWVRALLTTF
jgi:hypothetical protein